MQIAQPIQQRKNIAKQVASRWQDPHYTKSVSASIFLHVTVALVFGVILVAPVEYGLQVGQSGVDVELIAAPPAPEQIMEQETPDVPEQIVLPDAPAPDFAIPIPGEMPKPVAPKIKPVDKSRVAPVASKHVGDGSSPVPGKDKTTMRSSSGVQTAAKPDYLRNPPPKYPAEALRRKQEGTVLVLVHVNAEGRVTDLNLTKSSGHDLLDDAALRAVRGWRFQPAKAGGFAVESKVEVPVDFRIQDR